MLRNLQPSMSTSLEALQSVVAGPRGRKRAPSGLPDDILLSLARDFRAVEQMMAGGNNSADLAAPLFFVLQMVNQQHEGGFTLSEHQLAASLHIVQSAIEREVVTRITGIPSRSSDRALFKVLHETCRS